LYKTLSRRPVDPWENGTVVKEVVVTNANQTYGGCDWGGRRARTRNIALGLAAKNYRVFGTAFKSEEIEDFKRASSGA